MKALLLILFIFTGCGPRSKLIFDPGPEVLSQELVNSVSYNEVREKVFERSCLACHDQERKVSLETYSSAFNHRRTIRRTVKNKSMPMKPFHELTKTQIDLVLAWVQAGAPERPLDGSDPGEIRPVELKPTFTSIKENIFQRKCLICHSTGGSAERIPMETREELIESYHEIVIPGNPDDSGLMIVIEPGARKFMPPKKSQMSPVTDEEKSVIRKWIEEGAPE